jgi:L-iditol 2-dehydrogenase
VGRENLEDRVKAITGGYGADVVIVAVGALGPVRQGLGLVRPGGTLNIFAGQPAGSMMECDLSEIHYRELVITGSFGASANAMQEGLTLAATRLDFSPIVTKEFRLEDFMEAINYSAQRQGLRPVVVMS